MIARSALLAALALCLTTPLLAQEAEQGSPGRGATSRPQKPPAPKPSAPKPKPGSASGLPGGGQAQLVASFGDWGVYQARAEGGRLCYAATQPKDRQPKNLSRDPAYLFVSFRSKEAAKGEVAMVLGFTAKEGEAAEAAVGPTTYALITKGANAWLKNPAEDGAAVTTMQRGGSVVIKAVSGRGNKLTDRYSLTGFGQALERARKECAAAGA